MQSCREKNRNILVLRKMSIKIGKSAKDEIGTTGVVYCGLAKTMWREIRVYKGQSLLNT